MVLGLRPNTLATARIEWPLSSNIFISKRSAFSKSPFMLSVYLAAECPNRLWNGSAEVVIDFDYTTDFAGITDVSPLTTDFAGITDVSPLTKSHHSFSIYIGRLPIYLACGDATATALYDTPGNLPLSESSI